MPVWANTGGAAPRLIQYSSTGTQVSSVPLAQAYGDIAFSNDGATLYGINFQNAAFTPYINTINPTTGAQTNSVLVTGPLALTGISSANALSALPNGDLLVGLSTSNTIYVVNPTTGSSSIFPVAFPAGIRSAGDFIGLPGGDILAVGTDGTVSHLYRIRTDNTRIEIGTMPLTLGAAASGGSVYFFGSGGTIYSLATVPTTASTDPLSVTTVAATGQNFFGGSSIQDNGTCNIAPPPGAGMTCPTVPVWANTGGAAPRLIQYSSTGTQVSSVPLAQAYGDIAFSNDGATLYGINFQNAAFTPYINTINPTTGAQTNSVLVTGPLALTGISSANALSALPNGDLLVGLSTSNTIYVVNPTTGSSSIFPVAFPAGIRSAGDFIGLPGGDILAVGTDGTVSHLYRIRTDNTRIEIGTMPLTLGAAASGGSVYFFGSGGTIYSLATVPTTASTDPLSVTTVAATGQNFFGGSSIQDAGYCVITPTTSYTTAKAVSPAVGARPGDVLTYTITVKNTGDQPYGPTAASFTDDLAEVLDDATLVPGSVTSTAGTATQNGTKISWIGPLAVAPAAGSTATITYQLKVNAPPTGNKSLKNVVSPTASGGQCATASGCTTTTPVQIPSLTMVKSVAETDLLVGQTLHYSFVIKNTGNVTLAPVSVTESAFSGTGTAPAITCPAAAASLVPNGQVTCTATYTVTQADVDAGVVTNTAVAKGKPPVGPDVTTPPSSAQVPSAPSPALIFAKSADASAVTDPAAIGNTITYMFTAQNTGNVTLTAVTINDPMPGLSALNYSWPGPVGTLAPGQSVTATATYTVSQSDLDAKQVKNTATASGQPPAGPTVTPPPASTDTPLTVRPINMMIEKIGESADAAWVRMEGSSWTIYADANGTPGTPNSDLIVVPVPGEPGLFEVTAIPAGVYWLEENTAPDGFSLLAEPVQFTVAANGSVTLGQGAGSGVVTTADDDTDGTFTTTVRDVPALELPDSGGIGWWPFTTAGATLLILAIILSLRHTRGHQLN
ncbi:SpaA isopeptide-forming pilin-related protein (plasmid) [Paenarthrobacter sp. OM7]|uniref:DUF7507 domain-containing protein n=1 Tax=Paenarthrobacter sp. OM7 TaxID=3041264 RepID=UPI002468C94D|nr:SpaA isopeptide-forming pilin-related protein [Paenarthrobacter sp. OM7]WGM22906.1 SpaA isopeptide-forming pilin-related protein [Paenarthrobacter sp. OM7]